MSISDFLASPTEAFLAGSDRPIDQASLREKQISLCQHAPAVTKGIDGIQPIQIRWFEVTEAFGFSDAEELMIGNPFPSYRQFVAHLSALNEQLNSGEAVPELFQNDNDIVTVVQLSSSLQWLDMAVTDNYISFTCLGPTTKKLTPGRILLFAA